MNHTLSLPGQILQWTVAVFLIIILILATILVIVGGIKFIKDIAKKEWYEIESERRALEEEIKLEKLRKERK